MTEQATTTDGRPAFSSAKPVVQRRLPNLANSPRGASVSFRGIAAVERATRRHAFARVAPVHYGVR